MTWKSFHPKNAIAKELRERSWCQDEDGYEDFACWAYLKIDQDHEWWRWCVFSFEPNNVSMGEYGYPDAEGICATYAMAEAEGRRALAMDAKGDRIEYTRPAWVDG